MADRTAPSSVTTVLPTGETITVDGSTVTDPETGRRIPAAVVRLPAWRAAEMAAALAAWTRVQAIVLAEGAQLPTEARLPGVLAEAAQDLSAGTN